MKRLRRIIIILLVFVMTAGCLFFTANAQAKKRSAKKSAKAKVTCKLKKGTLTISGKGAMPKSMTFYGKKRKKIKKVVIKKGVTSISNYAFDNCVNLKKVSIPKSVKKIGYNSFAGTAITRLTVPAGVKSIGQCAFYGCKKLKKLTLPGDFRSKKEKGDDEINYIGSAKTVCFNTRLSLVNVTYFDADNLVVSKKDNCYKSIRGVIYSKDGKSIVRVPSLRKALRIEDGCTEFCLQSVLYESIDFEGDPDGGCTRLKKIVVPASVKKVEDEKYYAFSDGEGQYIKTLELHTNQLDGYSLMTLINRLPCVKVGALMKQFPEKITCSNNMYITNDGILLSYTGKEKNVKIPYGVKMIGDEVFCDNENIQTVEFPKTVVAIGDFAFSGCTKLEKVNLPNHIRSFGRYIFSYSGLKQAVLPSTMTVIPDYIFYNCEELKEVVMPDSVTVIGEYAFAHTALSKHVIGKRVKVIKEGAFCGTLWRTVAIPANVERIGENAFAGQSYAKKVVILGSTKNFAEDAFDCENAVFSYKASPKEWQTCIHLSSVSQYDKKKKTVVSCYWNKVEGVSGYQLKLSDDKKFRKKTKTVWMKKNKDYTKVTIKRLTGFPMYVKIRPYKVVKGKKVYGKWAKSSL